MTRRVPFAPVTAMAALALLVSSCAAEGPRDGWHTLRSGDLSVDVMDSWTKIATDDLDSGMFDLILQDTDAFDAAAFQRHWDRLLPLLGRALTAS